MNSRAQPAASAARLSNADIAALLTSLAQLLSAQGDNPFKVRAYRRGAETVRTLGDSIDELVRSGADLTQFPGIGKGLAGAIREIVLSGGLRQLESLRQEVSPELAAISEYPRLNPRLVLRIYQKLNIASLPALREKLESGAITSHFGARIAHYIRQGLTESDEILLYDAEAIVTAVETFLVERCRATRVEVAGDYRRRVEVVGELSFLVETADFPGTVSCFGRYGGGIAQVGTTDGRATFKHASGVLVTLERGSRKTWGVGLILATGSEPHLEKLEAAGADWDALTRSRQSHATEAAVYRKLGLRFIEPELREGHDEVERAAAGTLPALVTLQDIRGELHCHSTSSDGAHTIERMAAAARERGFDYIGIADHSQSLKIAGGVSEENLWKQIRHIDRLNAKLGGIRVLKSAEVDILADGRLDYPDELLRELDYTVCSIHSRFGLGKAAQTERILRAMDNRYFNILGHATGRLLLKRPGYEIDVERIVGHARTNGCFLEINASPDRLDLSSAHARLARDAGLKIAINTDAHSVQELDFLTCGVDQARRAGLEKKDVLNCLGWARLQRALER
jgi:DNA polymerase (family X)